ncbi:glycosyltransferase family 2 protein [Anaerobacillus arseniciselenatis]|nr:glycosyltransferase family A protein [Anaerobacillus arseniciselenatis]
MMEDKTIQPLVSIIIPCYNYGKYIEEAVQSALDQTYENIELIIVNDASTDPFTIDILEKLNHHSKLTIIHHESNKKLPAARNTAIKAASGKYILPIDADDKVDRTIVEKTVEVLEERADVGFVSVGIQYFGAINKVSIPSPFNLKTLLYRNIVSVTSLFRKEAWEQVGGYNEKFIYGYEDWEFWLNLAKHGWHGVLIKEPLFHYRKHGKSMIDDAVKKHLKIVSQIINIHSELYNETKITHEEENLIKR